MRLFIVVCMCAISATASAEPRGGTIAGSVQVLVGGAPKEDRSGVIVYVESVAGRRRGAPRKHEMFQKDKAFVPALLVVEKGDTVEFPNRDLIFHNVFSLSKGVSFDLGLHKSGTRPTTTFDRAGAIDVFCNIHPQMAATIRVLDNGHYAVTERDGSFRITGVPAGTHTVVAWIRNGKEQRQPVTVAPGQGAQASFELVEIKRMGTHLRKDGTPYPRYK